MNVGDIFLGLELERGDKNDLQKDLDGIGKKGAQSFSSNFRRGLQAIGGAALFSGIARGIGSVTQQAAVAEGTLAKFNTVFGEYADETAAYVTDLRKVFPATEQEIQSLASGIQDLLVPLGLNREEATGLTKDYLELANKVGAFNDVQASQVVTDFQSALAGSAETLRKYGINASQTAVIQQAVSDGLVESEKAFKSLSIEQQNQIRAQALYNLALKSSSDAVNGFEANNDSFLRRQQEITTQFKEIRTELGNAFLPVLDELQKAFIPILKNISTWVKENPELTATIVKVTAAAGLALGAFISLGAVIGPIGIAFAALTGPIGLTIAAIITTGLAIKALSEDGDVFVQAFRDLFFDVFTAISDFLNQRGAEIQEYYGNLFDAILSSIATWLLRAELNIKQAWKGIRDATVETWNGIKQFLVDTFVSIVEGIQETRNGVVGFFAGIMSTLADTFSEGWNFIQEIFLEQFTNFDNFFSSVSDAFFSAGGRIVDRLTQGILEGINAARRAVSSALSGLADFGSSVRERTSEILDGARADGGPVKQAGKYLVGERGPEIFVPKTSGMILPNHILKAVRGGGTTNNNNSNKTVNINMPSKSQDFSGYMTARKMAFILRGI